MSRTLPLVRAKFFVLSFILIIAVTAHAQYRATIQGVVTDPQGAIIPGAKLTLTDKATGRTLETASNDSGLYTFGSLAPTRYSLTAQKEGFKKKVLDDLAIIPEQS